jgi:superfamily II DNA or RNA helicase
LKPVYEDHRRVLEAVPFEFKGKLRPYQEKAVDDILKHDFGVLEAGTGSGKTVTALATIAARKQPALILCHTKELLNQWCDRIKQFLGVKAGKVGNGQFKVKTVTVATVQTARRHLEELKPHFGFIALDECHRVPSSTFKETISAFDSKYMLGLTATAYRNDGLDRLIFLTLGDRVHKMAPGHLRATKAILKPEVVTRKTGFTFGGDSSREYSKMITVLTQDRDRNRLIVRDVLEEADRTPGTLLIVSDRTEHLETLASILEGHGQTVSVLTGSTPKKRREAIVNDLAEGKVKALASTTSLIGEGFDSPGLASLFLATPVRFKGRLTQVVGRILRPQDGKRPRIIDFVDHLEPVLAASFRARQRVYKQLTS